MKDAHAYFKQAATVELAHKATVNARWIAQIHKSLYLFTLIGYYQIGANQDILPIRNSASMREYYRLELRQSETGRLNPLSHLPL